MHALEPGGPDQPPLLLSVFAGFGVGGQQVRFTTVVNQLGRSWRHAIVAMNGDLSCRTRLSSDLDVSFPPVHIGRGDPVGLHRRLRTVLQTLRPRILLTHNWGTIEWALANRFPRQIAPHLHAEDGFGPEEATRQLARRVWARRLALRRSTLILPSQTLLQLAERRWRLPSARLRYIPNGIDLDRFDRGDGSERPADWRLSPGGIVIGTVAALRPEKNLARLIQAVAQNRPETVRLVIVGDGPQRAELEHMAAALLPAGHFAFAGHMADTSPTYRAMDVFALSSDTEQMPLTVLEAMASSLPIVSTAVGDVAAMVAPSNRRFIVSCGVEPVAKALAALAASPALRAELGGDNRDRTVTQFGQAQMVERWGQLLGQSAEAEHAPDQPVVPA